MRDIDPDVYVKYVEQHCEHSPPDEAKDVTELWDSFDKDSFDQELADLWRWGLVEVTKEDGEQHIHLSAFGKELHEKGVVDDYLWAKLGETKDEVNTGSAVRVLDQ